MTGYLVTGGGGFIGSRIVEQLAARGERVFVLDKSNPPAHLAAISDISWTRGDVGDARTVFALVERERPRFIIHTAFAMDRADYRPASAEASPLTRGGAEMVAEQDLGLALAVNCGGMLNVLEAARLFRVDRVVYTSAVAAFGSALSALHDRPVGDQAVFAPDSMYGATKVLNETMATIYRDRFGVDSIGLRIARTFGTGNPAPFTDFLRNIALEKPVQLVDPDYFNSYIFVDDCADAHIFACSATPQAKPIFNLREGEYSNAELIGVIRRIHPAARITLVPGKGDGVIVPRMISSGLADELRWVPPHDLASGLVAAMNPWRIEAGLEPLTVPEPPRSPALGTADAERVT